MLGEYKYALVNDNLDVAVNELRAIVLTERGESEADRALAASCRTDTSSARLQSALETFAKEAAPSC